MLETRNNLINMHELSQSLSAPHWKKIGIRRHHGINTPLFSLRSRKSAGIGEYLDLLPLIDWCNTIHFDIIQLLPINDSGNDPSPYNALSAKALHPIYISLHALPGVQNHPELMQEITALQALNTNPRLNYSLILEKKTAFLKRYFDKEFINVSSSYETFVKENPWVEPYARFKCLKEKFGFKQWQDWPKDGQDVPTDCLEFHIFLQYLSFMQMLQVKAYAKDKGVFIKGDIPILISPDSADVWYEPHLFSLDYAAGAPPDMYSPDGQYWGFPLYNYDTMEKDGYRWWKERLAFSAKLYDLYRLDHIVGFFRIWAFLRDQKTNGKFIPEDRARWIPQGKNLLTMMLGAAPILPIGEDLGVIPPEVRQLMLDLGICGTKVIRWERYWEGDKSFIKPEEYSPVSMTTVSTHDSDTLKLWWQNAPDEAKEYARAKGWPYNPNLSNAQLQEMLKESHRTGSLFHINLLQEYLDLLPAYTWPNLSDERINIPGTQSERNWSYRYKPFLEEMVKDEELAKLMTTLIQ